VLTKSEISRLRSLREKRFRDETGLFVIEGEKAVGELLQDGFPIEALYATEDWTGGGAANRVTESEMEKISNFPTPSRVLAVAKIRREPLAAGELDRGLTLALDGVQDPGNLGSILRIADWYAASRVLISPDCADPFSAKAVQASMGSFARVRMHAVELSTALASAQVPIFGCDLEGADLHGVEAPPDAVLVIGSEGRGLSPAVRRYVSQFITIPRRGRAESLNAAVAAGIVCDALTRKNRG
jgi:TrmH family RNA methyltransferase